MSENTIYLIGIFVAVVSTFLLLSEFINRKSKLGLEISRKIFHLTAGTTCLVMILVFEENLPIIIIGSLFAITLPVSILLNLFSIQSKARGWGTVTFAIAFVILALLFWDRKDIFISAMAVLTYGDAFAAIVGKLWGKRKYKIADGYKTMEGSVTFFLISFVSIAATLFLFNSAEIAQVLWIAAMGALFATLVEATSTSNFDNATIPIGTATVLHLLLSNSNDENLQFISAVAFFFALSVISIKLNFVNTLGSIGVFLIFSIIHGIGGWMWTAPLLFFFLSASVMGRIEDRAFNNPFVEKKGKRDIKQIYAKGSLGLLLAMTYYFSGYEPLFYVYLAVIATAHSDTFSSSLGSFSKAQQLIALPTFKMVEKGRSGGVSIIGLFGGIVGAAVLALFIFISSPANAWVLFGIILVSGFAGNLMDSIIGTTLQAMYRCNGCNQITEGNTHCDNQILEPISGFRLINNDIVNLLSGLFGAIVCLLLLHFIL